jgi:tRNA-dihydrouridine synthase B
MNLKNKIFLAPLSQYTNLPFRVLCSEYRAQGTIVPLVSAKAICANKRKIKELDPHTTENFVGVQLFGSEPEDIREASMHVSQNYPFVKFIDINCACPVRKVINTGAGAALLKDPKKAARLIEAAAESGFPITVKIRKFVSPEKTLEFSKECESAGAKAIFIHGRTQSQGYCGISDWETVKHVSENISIPVIGSGDIRNIEQGKELQKRSNCAGLMIGRAAMTDPSVFSSSVSITQSYKYKLFKEYNSLCEKFDRVTFSDQRIKAIQFFSGFEHSTKLRVKIGSCKNLEELIETVKS